MFNNYNSFAIFILILVISITISFVLISICEFKIIFQQVTPNGESDTMDSKNTILSLEEFKDTNYASVYPKINIINVRKNLVLELFGSYEIFIPQSNIKKDVFVSDAIEVVMLEPGKPYICDNRATIEAFFYGDNYKIYYRKIK